MTSSSESSGCEDEPKRTRKYIPHLAEFYFQPDEDWTVAEAQDLYDSRDLSTVGCAVDTVYFTDCIKGMRNIQENTIDLIIADPPFGIDFDGKSGMYNRDESLVVDGYEEPEVTYSEFTTSWIAELPRILCDHGSVFIFSGWTNLEAVLRGAREAGLETINHIIWNYPFGVFTKRKFVTSHYHLLFLVKDPKEYYFNRIEHYTEDVWLINRRYHPGRAKNSTKLPLEIVMRCIDFASRPGSIVLDPFMGNGTTAIAAKRSFRHFLGFEQNALLQPIIDQGLRASQLGSDYIPYTERLPTIEELAELYPRAYNEYLKREQKHDEES
ncbi:MAG: Modification methylase [Candidatus Thorarchaeota archaeon]|nr:MAG: Modification methylase [Candidatus Thorarchaeota archaeon]